MKLKRYSAPDIRQALNKVRDELGPDAVILSNRPNGNGVEIIAAIDYDDAILDQTNEEINTRIANEKIDSVNVSEQGKQASQSSWNDIVSKSAPAREVKPSKYEEESSGAGQVSAEWLEKFKSSVEQKVEKKQQRQPTKAKPSAKAAETRPQLSVVEPVAEPAPVIKPAAATTQPNMEIDAVWDELHHIRGMLETQLSSLAWHDVSKRFPIRAKVLRHLFDLGLSPAMCQRLAKDANCDGEFEEVWRKVMTLLASRIPVVEEDMVKDGGVFALVGPTGVGKTTTIAKMAARFALTHGTKGIALITTDNYRIGAQEQLRTYGRILGTPVRIANDAQELKKTLKSLYDKQLILIDTAGMSQRDIRLTEQFAMLSEGSSLIKSFLVMPAGAQLQVLDETVKAYGKAVLDGCIITKVDETASLGGMLSTLVHHQLPIAYVSDGQRVPEDLHRARSIDLVKKAIALLKRTDLKADDQTMEIAFGGLAANDLS